LEFGFDMTWNHLPILIHANPEFNSRFAWIEALLRH